MKKIFVITGGPGTGKTSVVNELEKKGYKFLMEAARWVSENDFRFKGKNILEINKKDFQDAIFDLQKKQISELKGDEIVFSDRGIGDTLAYYKIAGLKISDEKMELAKKFKYEKVFVLDFFNFYQKDKLRQESKKEQEKIHNEIVKTYEGLGYSLIYVPFMSVKKRTRFILERI